MPEPVLNAFNGLPGVALVPIPVEGFGREPELDDEVAGQFLRLDFAPLFLPEAQQGAFVAAHDDAGVRAADEAPAIKAFARNLCGLEREGHDALQFSFSRISFAALRITRSASADESWNRLSR